jgi:hypothetical protein
MSPRDEDRRDDDRRDDDLHRALAEEGQRVLPGETCPTPEQLWQLASGELEALDARPIVDHLSRCPACAEDARLTRELVRESRDVEGRGDDEIREDGGAQGDDGARPSGLLRGPWLGLLAALLALSVGLGVIVELRGPDPGGSALRQGGSERVQSLLDDGAELPRNAARLVWVGPPGARFDGVLTTEDLELVAEVRGLEVPEWILEPEQLEDLEAGTVLFWQVEAVLEDGSRVPSRSFRVVLVEGLVE